MADGAAFNMLSGSPTALSQRPTWWTEEKIDSTVTVRFVTGKLKVHERAQLHRPLNFGDGLTDDTYLDFILDRAKMFFLILSEIGTPGRIFSLIDLSYDDSDLPLPRELVPQLELSSKLEDKINRKFFERQYQFQLRDLQSGVHNEYEHYETVPLETTYKLPPDCALHTWTRFRLAKSRDDEIFARRRLATAVSDGTDRLPEEFFDDLEVMRYINHDHIVPVWGSYSFKGSGYILTSFLAHHSLKSCIELGGSIQYQRLPKAERQKIVLEWIHGLADALAYLHQKGFHHTAIRPSNIVIDPNHTIAFSDIGALKTFQTDKIIDPKETYNYSAPEARLGENYPRKNVKPSKKDSLRKRLKEASMKTSRTSTPVAEATPSTPQSSSQRSQAPTRTSTFSFRASTESSRPRLINVDSIPIPHIPPIPESPICSRASSHRTLRKSPSMTSGPDYSIYSFTQSEPFTEQTDIFSLGCVFLDMISFLCKYKSNDMATFIHTIRKCSTASTHHSRFVDASFHANLPKVNQWIDHLEKRASHSPDKIIRLVPHVLRVVLSMLSEDPDFRPSASNVRDQLSFILTQSDCFDNETNPLHCGTENRFRQTRSINSAYPSSTVLNSPISPTTSDGWTSAAPTSSSNYASGKPDMSWATSISSNPTSSATPASPSQSCHVRKNTPPNFSRLLKWGAFRTMPV